MTDAWTNPAVWSCENGVVRAHYEDKTEILQSTSDGGDGGEGGVVGGGGSLVTNGRPLGVVH